jgi:peptide deformylase
MIRPVVIYNFKPTPVSEPITEFGTDELKQLETDLFETVWAANGVGLAAMQIGVYKQMAVIHLYPPHYHEDVKFTICNPKILEASGKQCSKEGCLSLPGRMANNVPAAAEAYVQFQELDGTERRMVFDGLAARAFQHEIEHMAGKYFFERTSSIQRTLLLGKFRKERTAMAKGKITCRIPITLNS